MNKKLASILAIALCLSSCGSTGASTPSQTETTTTAASEVESQQYEDITINDDIIIPSSAKAELTDKGESYYSIMLDDKWKMMISADDLGDDIIWLDDEMEHDSRAWFVLCVASEPMDLEKAEKIECTTSEDYVNGYKIYTFDYNNHKGYAACNTLGTTKYILACNDYVYNLPTIEEFKSLIESLKIAP